VNGDVVVVVDDVIVPVVGSGPEVLTAPVVPLVGSVLASELVEPLSEPLDCVVSVTGAEAVVIVVDDAPEPESPPSSLQPASATRLENITT
jgi:hypothetical protein